MNRYEINYKSRITKVPKRALVIAKTKVEAKRMLAVREASPIIQSIYQLETVDIAFSHIEQIEFVKGV